MKIFILKEELGDWRHSKRLYIEYIPPAECDGLVCEFSPVPVEFVHAHVTLRGEEPNTTTRFIPLDKDNKAIVEKHG